MVVAGRASAKYSWQWRGPRYFLAAVVAAPPNILSSADYLDIEFVIRCFQLSFDALMLFANFVFFEIYCLTIKICQPSCDVFIIYVEDKIDARGLQKGCTLQDCCH